MKTAGPYLAEHSQHFRFLLAQTECLSSSFVHKQLDTVWAFVGKAFPLEPWGVVTQLQSSCRPLASRKKHLFVTSFPTF